MATPQYGIHVIAGYGNGASTNAASPAISNLLTIGNPHTMHAPSLTVPPIMPLIERITPRTFNASEAIRNTKGYSLARATTAVRFVSNNAVANGRAAILLVRDRAKGLL